MYEGAYFFFNAISELYLNHVAIVTGGSGVDGNTFYNLTIVYEGHNVPAKF